ncbi:MAG: periplasmic heavy metal sensor [Proteobacteria bacterium]|nr:periplasmic heavy metal sensor [Pseudomonadota bacterium]
MSERVKTIFLIFSLAINLGVLGIVAYSWVTSSLHTAKETAVFPEKIMTLSGFQKEEIEKKRESLMSTMIEKRRTIQAQREALLCLLMAPTPDYRAISTKMKEINQIQGGIQQAAVDQILFETQRMTPDQRKLYFTNIRTRMCRPGMMGSGFLGIGPRCDSGEGTAGKGK